MKKSIVFAAVAFIAFSCDPKKSEVVTEPVTAEPAMPTADIGEGKVVYLKSCTGCHGKKKVEDFTRKQWDNILPRMVKNAELNDDEVRQVTAYVHWELEND